MNPTSESGYRYERKSYISNKSLADVEYFIKHHYAIFSEIYKERLVNNIYFDSIGLSNFHNNIDGLKDRIKVRIRWYGKLFGIVEKPTLEIKIKNGALGKKISVLMPSFQLDSRSGISNLLFENLNLNNCLKLYLKSLKPLLMNQYLRKYYRSIDENFRITVDRNQIYYRIDENHNLFLNKNVDNDSIILELKYDQKYDFDSRHISTRFPFRFTKNSKYINGISRIFNFNA